MEGISRYTYETTLHMAELHAEDDFYLFFDRKPTLDFSSYKNIKKIIVPWHARLPILWYLWFEWMIPLYLWWYKIDVFYSPDGYLSLRTTKPSLLVIHDIAYFHYPQHMQAAHLNYYKKFVPLFLRRANRIITVSHYVKGDLVNSLQVDPNRIAVAYNAVHNPALEHQFELPKEIKSKIQENAYFLYVGAIHPRKNIVHLIQAFQRFQNKSIKPFKLVLAGRLAWDTDVVATLIKNNTQIVYLDVVNENVKYALIKNAMAVTYISLFEGFGIPILEAMACGTPVITSSVTSMPEIAGDAAILVDPNNVEDIAVAMLRISEDANLRRSLASKGLTRHQMFLWSKSANIIYSTLKNIHTESLS